MHCRMVGISSLTLYMSVYVCICLKVRSEGGRIAEANSITTVYFESDAVYPSQSVGHSLPIDMA